MSGDYTKNTQGLRCYNMLNCIEVNTSAVLNFYRDSR